MILELDLPLSLNLSSSIFIISPQHPLNTGREEGATEGDPSKEKEVEAVAGSPLQILQGLSCCCCVASVVSDPVRPQRPQPTRLPRPWDSPGKNTGVGCHCLLQCMKVKSEREVAQSCRTLRDPMDCSPPGSSIHWIFQARVLEWGAIDFGQVI